MAIYDAAHEDWELSRLLMRLLVEARRNGATLTPDPTAGPVEGGAKEQWRWQLSLPEQLDVYSHEHELVETILNCDCPCPSECGSTIVRLCTLRIRDAPSYFSSQRDG